MSTRPSEKQQKLLEEFSKSRTVSKCVAQRAMIILLGFAGLFNEDIALQVGLNRMQVGIWRQRWRDTWNALCVWECAEPHRLREAMIEMNPTPMGGAGKSVQADETYYGNSSKRATNARASWKRKSTLVCLRHATVAAAPVRRAPVAGTVSGFSTATATWWTGARSMPRATR